MVHGFGIEQEETEITEFWLCIGCGIRAVFIASYFFSLELLHQTLYAGHPDRLAGLEQARLEDELGRRVRSLREAAGLTQTQLARRLGVAPGFVADLEEAAIETNYLLWLQRVAAVVSKRVQIRCLPLRRQLQTA